MAKKQIIGAELGDADRFEQVFQELHDQEAEAEKNGRAGFLERARLEMERLVKWLSSSLGAGAAPARSRR